MNCTWSLSSRPWLQVSTSTLTWEALQFSELICRVFHRLSIALVCSPSQHCSASFHSFFHSVVFFHFLLQLLKQHLENVSQPRLLTSEIEIRNDGIPPIPRSGYIEKPFLLPESLHGRTHVRSLGRSYADVITNFSGLDGLPIFLTHCASLARFARRSSATMTISNAYGSVAVWSVLPRRKS